MTGTQIQIAGLTKTEEIKEQYVRSIWRKLLFIFSILLLLIFLIGYSATLGSMDISISQVYSTIFNKIGLSDFDVRDVTKVIVLDVRLPRILLAIVAGAGLAIAGTVMQGILRNPLASPFTLGISSGAGFGAALAILLGAGFATGKYLIIGNAFLFALIPTFIILGLTQFKRATPETMILAGIAILYIFSAMTTLLMFFSSSDAVKAAYFWTVGSLGNATWDSLLPASIMLVCCTPLLFIKSWDVNIMGAGDETAKSLGVNVDRTRISVLMIATLLTAAIVCFVGTIGFIGLVAPHVCRMVVGGDNRFLIPTSGLFGAALLLGADSVARTIIAPAILPVGVITAFMGGPLFLYLIMRRRKEYW